MKAKEVVVDVFGGRFGLHPWPTDPNLMMLDVDDGSHQSHVPLTAADAKYLRRALAGMTTMIRATKAKSKKTARKRS